MRTPTPIPEELKAETFTRKQALSLGIKDERLEARDIERVGRGIYRYIDQGDTDHFDCSAKTAADACGELAHEPHFLHALQDEYQGSWFSHSTAASIFGITLPDRVPSNGEIHISRQRHSTKTRRLDNLQAHKVLPLPGEVIEVDGLWVSRPRRIFYDLMNDLSERELIALGDQLVRRPRPKFEGRSKAWETVSSLRSMLDGHRKTKGIRQARRVIEQVRVGADSSPETYLRLALIEAGLPEPELQVKPSPYSIYSGDMGYPELKCVIQYDGAGHFTAEQQARDQRRDYAFQRAGWTVISVNVEDYREKFVTVSHRLWSLLGESEGD